MSWLIRPREERDIYSPNECPNYTAADLFTIKLYYGGVISENPRNYVGGDFVYVDGCNVDMMSIIELKSMLTECGQDGCHSFSYKFPKTDWVNGVWTLESDADVLDMGELVPPSRLVFVFSVSITSKPLAVVTPDGKMSQEYNPSQDPNLEFVENDHLNLWRRLNKSVELIKGCHVVWSGGAKYLVTMSDGGYPMMVDLEAKRCACRKWEISGRPCYHACACISWSKKNYEEYIHACYSKDSFLATYNHILDPICGEEEWDATDYPKPLPPILKVQTGRPKKSRNKTNDATTPGATRLKRQNTKVRCSYCTEYSHNMRTCPARAHDKANGCEKQVKTRTKKAKTAEVSGGKDASNSRTLGEASQGGQETPNQGRQSGERRATRSTTLGEGSKGGERRATRSTTLGEGSQGGERRATRSTTLGEGSQGGVFTNINTQQGTNNPLGVQALGFTTKDKAGVTSLRNLELARKKRESRLKKKPVWKL